MRWNALAEAVGIQSSDLDIEVAGIGIDTRQPLAGCVYVAIEGDRFDGHAFIDAAAQAGAVGCVVSRPVQTSLPCLQVADTRRALGQIAHWHRQRLSARVLAMTGSCGKTTVKALLASILGQVGPTLASPASYNNDIGVPLTLLSATPAHAYVVCEMGANHMGEIAPLTAMAQPDVAAITNAAAAHLAGFGDLDGVARAKAEIFSGLSSAGVAVVNMDDAYASFWCSLLRDRRVIGFGLSAEADVRATEITFDALSRPSFLLCLPEETVQVALPLLGRHQVMNALTAAAMAYAEGVDAATIAAGLNQAVAAENRLTVMPALQGARVIDDSFNANPSSVQAAIDVLAAMEGDTVLVLGDMGELGAQAAQYHHDLGVYAQVAGITQLFCVGPHSRETAVAFGQNAQHFDDKAALLAALKVIMHPALTVLVKGSHAMGMVDIVQGLQCVNA